MESRNVPGLYFIGEVVDVTGWLGGYNFQWAWSSGWVAGQVVLNPAAGSPSPICQIAIRLFTQPVLAFDPAGSCSAHRMGPYPALRAFP